MSLWHTTSQTSNHLRLVPWTWQWVHYTELASTVTWYQSSRAPLGCSESGDSHHGCGTERSAAVVRCYPVIMDQKLCSTLLKERRQLLSQGVKIRTSKMKGLVSGKVLGESLFFLTVFGLYRKTKLYPLYKILYILFYIHSHVFIIVKLGQGVSSLQDFL